MRKTEIGLGVAAGITGIVLTLLSMMSVLSYSAKDIVMPHDASSVSIYFIVLLAANTLGVIGAIIIRWHHVLGSVVMMLVTIIVLIFGFPWQSVSAVMYIMSVVLAMVPVKYAEE